VTISSRTLGLAAALMMALAAPARNVAAQNPTLSQLAPPPAGKVQRLTLRDGTQLVGKILSVDSTWVRFESAIGVSTIPLASIARIEVSDAPSAQAGEYSFPNPDITRLIFAPTGRNLKQGEGYFSDFYIFFPGINVGVTDRVSVGGMVSIIPNAGLDEQIYFFTPKVGLIQSAETNIAAGALVMHTPIGDGFTAGILYGVGTWGSPDASLTGGLGYGFVDGKLGTSPFLMLGGVRRVSDRAAIVTENWLLPGGKAGFASGGVRLLARGLAVDFALAGAFGGGGSVFPIPIVGFIWKW
jgi:hypothetical protein